jgi:hypothetical protein
VARDAVAAGSATPPYNSVPLGEELGGDAEGDFVRVIRAEGEADGAVELFRALGGEAGVDHFAAENLGFGVAADHTDEGEIPLSERAL